MAVIITDMDMPINCSACEESGISALIGCQLIYKGCANCGRHPNCPLIEVKEEEDCISRAEAIKWIENLRDINEYYHPSSKNNYLICCDSAIDDLRQIPSVHPKYGAEDYIPKHKIYAAIKEIKEEKAITSAEIIENDRQDLVNYKTALNYCLEILEQHIKGNEGE